MDWHALDLPGIPLTYTSSDTLAYSALRLTYRALKKRKKETYILHKADGKYL